MDILVSYLQEDRTCLGGQLSCDNQAVLQSLKVRVNTESPGISKCSDLFRLPGDIIDLPVFDFTLSGAYLPV
jgi:hypothetical protein